MAEDQHQVVEPHALTQAMTVARATDITLIDSVVCLHFQYPMEMDGAGNMPRIV